MGCPPGKVIQTVDLLNAALAFYRGFIGDNIGDYFRVIKGDTRSSDYSSYRGGYRVSIRVI